jgi:hypothetical protein
MPTIRFNIEASNFPLLSHYFGPSVAIRSRSDNEYIVTNTYSGTQSDSEIGLAQPLYMHNVVPVADGYQAVGYRQEVAPHLSANGEGYNQVLILRNKAEQRHFLGLKDNGRAILHDKQVGWLGLGAASSAPATRAYVNARTFIHFQNEQMYEYDTVTRILQPVTLQGINAYALKGITYNGNYLIGYDNNTIYWSSGSDPTDFRPSLISTSSAAHPQTIRGAITCVLPISNGFIIYTTHNAVAALWTGNTVIPWTFREIPGSAGVMSPEHVSYESNYDSHFAWTTSGLQELNATRANIAFPEVTDYISQRYFEQWDAVPYNVSAAIKTLSGTPRQVTALPMWPCDHINAGVLTQYAVYSTPRVKINFIGSRFLAISIGTPSTLRIILVYDLGLKRWGKLMIDHTDVFEYSDPGGAAPDVNRSFGILKADGSIVTLNRDSLAATTEGVFLFGRIALGRDYDTLIKSITLAHGPSDGFKVNLFSAGAAREYLRETPLHMTPVNSNITRTFKPEPSWGEHHALALQGKFRISGLEMDLSGQPRR